jgi:hypothetical protein
VASSDNFVAKLQRFSSDGTLDMTFATNGAYRFSDQGSASFNQIGIDPNNGEIYLVGSLHSSDENGNSFFDPITAQLDRNGKVKQPARVIDPFESDRSYSVVRNGRRFLFDAEDGTLTNVGASGSVDLYDGFPDADLSTNFFRQRDGKLVFAANGNSTDHPGGGLFRLNADLTRDSTFGDNGLLALGGSGPVVTEAPDGSTIYAARFGERIDVNDVDSVHIQVGRIFRDDRPTATVTARNIRSATTSTQVINVTYRDDHGINLNTLDNRDSRVSGPNGFVGAARFIGLTTELGGLVVHATYKLVAPGRSWDPSDNGAYAIRLYDGAISDVNGNANVVRDLGSFVVKIS